MILNQPSLISISWCLIYENIDPENRKVYPSSPNYFHTYQFWFAEMFSDVRITEIPSKMWIQQTIVCGQRPVRATKNSIHDHKTYFWCLQVRIIVTAQSRNAFYIAANNDNVSWLLKSTLLQAEIKINIWKYMQQSRLITPKCMLSKYL